MGWGSVKGKVKQTEDTSIGHCRRHCEANRPLRHDFIQVRGEVIGQQDQGICIVLFFTLAAQTLVYSYLSILFSLMLERSFLK